MQGRSVDCVDSGEGPPLQRLLAPGSGGRDQFGRLALPVLLVRGALANPAMVAITDELAACLPQVRTAVVEDAGHFLITSHGADCARLLSSFLADVA